MLQFLKYQKLTLLWALFVLFMCFGSFGEEMPGQNLHLYFPGFDKLTHCGLLFVLTTFAAAGFIMQKGRLSLASAFGLFILNFAVGGAIELLQHYVFTWRSGDWNDLFADTVGVCMALFTILVTQFAIRNEKN